MPDGVKLDEARAQFNNGVLEISIPVPESQRTRSVPIEEEMSDRKEAGSHTAAKSASKAG